VLKFLTLSVDGSLDGAINTRRFAACAWLPGGALAIEFVGKSQKRPIGVVAA